MTRILRCLLMLMLFGADAAQAQRSSLPSQDPIVGLWQTEDKDAVVQFFPCEEHFCGRFYWLKDDSIENPSRDDHNTDSEKKKRLLCGLSFLGGFIAQEGTPDVYTNGWVYSPRHGNTYSAKITLLEKNKLELRGFMFFSFLGGSQVWTRVSSSPRCGI